MMVQRPGLLLSVWETWAEFPVPVFDMLLPSYCRHVGNEPVDGKSILSVILSLFCFPAFHVVNL